MKSETICRRRIDFRGTYFLVFFLLTIFGALLYSNTLDVPWYFDDYHNIVENSKVHSLSTAEKDFFAPRGLALLTFAANFSVSKLQVQSYHLVNIGIHLLASFFVFLILNRMLSGSWTLALFGAFIFLVHPVQTQAVTYVVQRMTSLGGLLFFAGFYFYIKARDQLICDFSFLSARHLFCYLLALIFGALAILAKENAAIFPFALVLFELFFVPKEKRSLVMLVCYIAPFMLAPGWFAYKQLLAPIFTGEAVKHVSDRFVTINSATDSSYEYFITQFKVIWTYIRLMFFPFRQLLDYGYPIERTILTVKNIVCLVGIGGILCLAFILRKRAKLVSFAIFWFFLTLAVESSFIILDPIFEHRLYVPMLGFSLLVVQLISNTHQEKVRWLVMVLLVSFLSLLTWQRNSLWRQPVLFYEQNLSMAPDSERVRVGLSRAYMEKGMTGKAEKILKEAIAINPNYHTAHLNLSKIYIEQGRLDEAEDVLKRGVDANPSIKKLLNNLGCLLDRKNKTMEAIDYFNRVIAIDPSFSEAYTNLGVVYAGMQQWEKAEYYHRQAITKSNLNPTAYYNLGVSLYFQDKLLAALDAFQKAWQLKPDFAEALFNVGSVAMDLGDQVKAKQSLVRLKKLDAELATKLEFDLSKQSGSLQK